MERGDADPVGPGCCDGCRPPTGPGSGSGDNIMAKWSAILADQHVMATGGAPLGGQATLDPGGDFSRVQVPSVTPSVQGRLPGRHTLGSRTVRSSPTWSVNVPPSPAAGAGTKSETVPLCDPLPISLCSLPAAAPRDTPGLVELDDPRSIRGRSSGKLGPRQVFCAEPGANTCRTACILRKRFGLSRRSSTSGTHGPPIFRGLFRGPNYCRSSRASASSRTPLAMHHVVQNSATSARETLKRSP